MELSEALEALRRRGYKLTPQRLTIVKALLEGARSAHGHPGAQEIYARVKRSFPMLTAATVYNTLGVLAELGLVTKLGSPGASTRYDLNPKSHLNLICLSCGRIDDLDLRGLEAQLTKIIGASGYAVRESQLEYRGYCPRCRKKMAKRTKGGSHEGKKE